MIIMADALRAGRGLHTDFGADVEGLKYKALVAAIEAGDQAAETTRLYWEYREKWPETVGSVV